LYGVRSPGFGSFALLGQVVIISLEQEAGDGDPVVALSDGKIFLRRLLGDRRDPSRVVLACDRTGPKECRQPWYCLGQGRGCCRSSVSFMTREALAERKKPAPSPPARFWTGTLW